MSGQDTVSQDPEPVSLYVGLRCVQKTSILSLFLSLSLSLSLCLSSSLHYSDNTDSFSFC